MTAFVSFVRAYSKHEASYIFRVKDLDLIGVAKSFGLLRLPHMPELRDMPRGDWEEAAVDVSPYFYLYVFQLKVILVELVRVYRQGAGGQAARGGGGSGDRARC